MMFSIYYVIYLLFTILYFSFVDRSHCLFFVFFTVVVVLSISSSFVDFLVDCSH